MDRNLLKLFSNLRSSEMRQLSELLMEPSRSATTQLVLEAQRPGSRGLEAVWQQKPGGGAWGSR